MLDTAATEVAAARPLYGQADNSVCTMRRVLKGPRAMLPLDDGFIDRMCDDLNAVFDEDSFPDDAEVRELTLRLRGSLMQLVAAVPDPPEGTAPATAVDIARRLLDLEPPSSGPYLSPRVHLTRVAHLTSYLLDLFDENGVVAPVAPRDAALNAT
ncbi:DUF6415 family natural product biosynthesis protein [Streptomyces sp. NPDC005065]|uniref:DUF6415 family natural product biosynthesis protein n=1 Tax=Streptomyces sp. NPDC005065 TaxID=3154461 RepID=UPI00339F2604